MGGLTVWLLSVSTSFAERRASLSTASVSAPGTVLQWKVPQSSRPLHGSPGGATFTTNWLRSSLCLTSALTSARSIQAKPESPTVALLLSFDAFYIMCASGPFHSLFFFLGLQPLNVKKRGLFVSLVLDCQLRATPTTFTHTDSRLPRRVKFKPKGFCKIPADAFLLVTYLLWTRCFSECDVYPPLPTHAGCMACEYICYQSVRASSQEGKGFPQRLYRNP